MSDGIVAKSTAVPLSRSYGVDVHIELLRYTQQGEGEAGLELAYTSRASNLGIYTEDMVSIDIAHDEGARTESVTIPAFPNA